MLSIIVCCRRYFGNDYSPVFIQFWFFLSAFFLLADWVYLYRCFGCCCGFFFLFPLFFSVILCCVCLCLCFDHFFSDRIFCLFCFFFVLFLACTYRVAYIHAWGVPGHPLHATYSLLWSVAPMCRSQFLPNYPAPHTLAKIMPCGPICDSVCLFFFDYLDIYPLLPIQFHRHPHESLLTPISLYSHICLLTGQFPATSP